MGTASHTAQHGNKQQAHTEGVAARGMHAAGKQHVVSTSLQQMMRKEAQNTDCIKVHNLCIQVRFTTRP